MTPQTDGSAEWDPSLVELGGIFSGIPPVLMQCGPSSFNVIFSWLLFNIFHLDPKLQMPLHLPSVFQSRMHTQGALTC